MRALSLRDPALLAIVGGVEPPVFVGAASAAGTTLTMPTHEAGDLIVGIGVRTSNLSPGPSIAAGEDWIAHDLGNNGTDTFRTAYKIATDSSEAMGTWTDATMVAIIIFRGASGSPIGETAQDGGNSLAADFPAIPTPDVSDGSTIFAEFAFSTGSHSSFDTPPAGTSMVFRNQTASTNTIASHSTEGGDAAYPGGTTAFGTTRRWITYVAEVKAGTP